MFSSNAAGQPIPYVSYGLLRLAIEDAIEAAVAEGSDEIAADLINILSLLPDEIE